MLILHSLPKAELHLHLEGSIEPETLLELGATGSNYQYADFSSFIEAFKRVTSYLRSPEDYGLVSTVRTHGMSITRRRSRRFTQPTSRLEPM